MPSYRVHPGVIHHVLESPQFLAPFERAGFDYEVIASAKPGESFQDLLVRIAR